MSPENTPPSAIGHKALAVNLSDLAAMGAEPAWATLSLSMPEADESFLHDFSDGLFALAEQFGVELVDLDALQAKRYENPSAGEYKEIHLPQYLEGAALVSVPPAKDHTITQVTLGLKNMVGCLHASHYSGYWSYKKSQIHAVNTDQAVADLMLYIRPHLTIIDAIEGLVGGHLSGRVPNPPLERIITSTDVLAADREAARLLGHDPGSIRHLTLAEQFLG